MEELLKDPINSQAFLLLFKSNVCFRCILRLFRMQLMDLYRDRAHAFRIIGSLSDQLKLQPSLLHSYDVNDMKIKSDDMLCRLCLGLLQHCDKNEFIQSIAKQIKQSHYEFEVFKFNIKVPNSTIIRFSQAIEYLRANVKGMEKNTLLTGWRQACVEIKTVLKWILAPLVSKQIQKKSSAEEGLQINLNFDNDEDDYQNFNKFHSLLKNMAIERLNKKQEKIQKRIKTDKLDNLKAKVDNIQPSQANLNKILAVDGDFALRVLHKNQFCPQVKTQCQLKVEIRCQSVFIFGYYVKYSRYLSQTPWVVDGKKLAESSIQQELEKVLLKYFYPEVLRCSQNVKFHSGGREDIDVRMLSNGRPFALEFCCPRFNLLSDPSELPRVTEQINSSKYLRVNRLQFSTNQCLQILKKSQEEKVKAYACFVRFQKPYSAQDVQKLNQVSQLVLNQKTPLRVMHRRTVMVRQKIIHKLQALPIDKNNMILNVLSSAGTYIKEFVHGDLGRTSPNVGQITHNQADIIQLDVLKIYEKMDEQVVKDFMSIAQKF